MYLSHSVEETDLDRYRGHPIALERFQGPLDLLLHLIRKDQIEIWEIEICRITRQYLEYLASLRSLEIEPAGEFLVMAATLMRIKSQNLLPRPSFLPDELEGEEPLTREGLIARLLEYKKYREAARAMLRLESTQARMHAVGAVAALAPRHLLPLREPSLIDLAEYFQDLLRRSEPATGHEVHLEDVKLEDQMDWIAVRMGEAGEWERLPQLDTRGLAFRRLLRRPWHRLEIAVTFLAVLELGRLQRLRLWQERALSELWLLEPGPAPELGGEEGREVEWSRAPLETPHTGATGPEAPLQIEDRIAREGGPAEARPEELAMDGDRHRKENR